MSEIVLGDRKSAERNKIGWVMLGIVQKKAG